MKKIRILFVSENAYGLFNESSKTVHGGAEVQLFYLAKELSKRKEYDVGFVVRDQKYPRIEKYGNISLFKLGMTNSKIFFFKLLIHFANSLRFNYFYDIIQLIYFALIYKSEILIARAPGTVVFKTFFAARLLRRKFVYMVAHDTDCERKHPLLKKKFSQVTFNFTLRHADLIIAQTIKQKNKLSKIGINKVKFIRSGQPPAKTNNKLRKKNYILWVARVEKWKRPEILLELARKLKKYNFVMVAPGFDMYPDYDLDFLSEITNTPNIRFINKVPFSEIDMLFREAKIFINTSLYEGFPNTFIQSWKNSTPVVSLDVDPDDIIKTNKLGYQSKTISNMCKHIKKLMIDDPFYKKTSKNCYKYYVNNLHINRMVKSHASVYKNLMK